MAGVEMKPPLTGPVFSNLDVSIQEEILMRNIIFQGENTSLKDLLAPSRYVDFDDIIDSSLLSKLNNNEEISVGTALSSSDKDLEHCYIPRSFSNADDIITEEQMCMYEESEWQFNVTIPDVPGSGKSTVLNQLARKIKKNYPYSWVIKINFCDYSECLAKFKENKVKPVTVVDLLNSRPETRFKNDLERKIFSMPHKVVLMVDGIEETCSEYVDIIDDIMADYYTRRNLIKVCMTSLRYMDNYEMAVWPCYSLVPFSEEEQIICLKSCVEQKSGCSKHEKLEACAEEIVKRKWFHEDEDSLVGVPLQIRMLADVLCRKKNIDEVLSQWEDYYEFLFSNKSELQVKKINLAKLFLLFIHQNCSSDETILNAHVLRAGIAKTIQKSRYHLYTIALEQTLTKDNCELFDSYKNTMRGDTETLLALKIVKKVKDRFRFSHKTVAEYFLADCIAIELHQTENKEFSIFFVETVLTRREFKLVRLFFENITSLNSSSVSDNTLKDIGHIIAQNPSTVLHNLVREGCLKTFKLIFECLEMAGVCLDFDIVRLRDETLLQNAITAGQFGLMEFMVKKGASVKTRDDDDRTPLHHAIKKDTLSAVKFLVRNGAEVRCKDINGRTPLQDATLSSSLDIMEYLISHEAVVNSKDKNGCGPLQEAIRIGDMDKVKYLVEKCADINNEVHSGTPIFEAAWKREIDILKYLLGKCAEVSFKNGGQRTVLHKPYSYSAGSLSGETTIETLKLLIELGADVNAVDNSGNTVLSSYVDAEASLDIIKFLVDSGADAKRRNNYNFSPLDGAIREGAIRDGAMETVKYLMEMGVPYCNICFNFVVDKGRLDMAEYLVENGADVNHETKHGYTLLNRAIYNDDMDMIRFLVENGGNVNSKGTGCLIETTLLEDAVQRCSFDIVKYLVERGAKEEDALEYAAERGDLRLVKYLEEQGARCDKIRDVGGNLDLLRYFVDKRACVDMPSILNRAAIKGRVDIAKYVINEGVDVSATNYHGRSALHEAAKHDFLNIVELLLRYGADIDCKDNKGETPLNKAFNHDHLEVAKFLVEKGADFSNVPLDNHEAFYKNYYPFKKLKFLVEGCGTIDVREEPYSCIFDIALGGCYFSVAEYLVEKSVGNETMTDIVNRLIEMKDDRLPVPFKHWNIVTYLLQRGICIGNEEIEKYNLLITAASESDFKYVKYLVEKGADVNQKDEEGCTALHKASDFGIVKYLVGRGADVNAKTKDGWSVLHEAVESSNCDVCEFLVENGADVHAVDNGGSTVAYTAAKKGSFSKLKCLLEKGATLTVQESRTVLHDFIHFEDLRHFL